jgi:hypothetical protein
MTAIALPDDAIPNSAVVFLREFGTILTPFLGGPEQYVDRVGTRFGLRVTLPPKNTRDEARVIQSRLLQGRKNRLLMEWPQPGVDVGNPGAGAIRDAVIGGTTVPIKNLAAGYQIKEGQFFSVIHGGRRYVYMATADVTANDGYGVDVPIFPLLRTPLAINDVVEIETPMIEGFVSPGEELSWQISVDRLVPFSFTISEGA